MCICVFCTMVCLYTLYKNIEYKTKENILCYCLCKAHLNSHHAQIFKSDSNSFGFIEDLELGLVVCLVGSLVDNEIVVLFGEASEGEQRFYWG